MWHAGQDDQAARGMASKSRLSLPGLTRQSIRLRKAFAQVAVLVRELRSACCHMWSRNSASGNSISCRRAATRADPMFAEAWYNLSDLLDEQGRSQAAVDCLRRGLQAAPDYADAMFNHALLLQRASQHKEAAEYWRRYLANDIQSEWAARARRTLKFCEMQIHLSAG
jgi:tetratricopeptide (TPR) repeat protein